MTENLPVHRSAREIPIRIFSPARSPPIGQHGWSTKRREDAAGQVLDGGNAEKKKPGLYSINCNSWWIHRMFVVSNNIVWISVRRPWKMKSNQLQSFPTIFIFLNLSCPVLKQRSIYVFGVWVFSLMVIYTQSKTATQISAAKPNNSNYI
jgi:hypothetical protein